MYVLQSWAFTPGPENVGNLVIPGVYKAEQFGIITNLTRNIPFFSPDVHELTITVTDDGTNTTVVFHQNSSFCKTTDKWQIVMYDLYSGGGGPSSNVSVTNWPVSQAVSGTVTANQGTSPWVTTVGNFPVTQPVSGTVSATQGTSPWLVSGSLSSTVSSFPTTATDAFGRLRVSQPYTLFDSSHRYSDNNLWTSLTTGSGTTSFNASQGLVELSVSANGDSVIRETTKVFSYQPGKSLLILTTFVLAAGTAGLTQRVGYYGDSNGYYLELADSTLSLVERSLVTGAVVNTSVPQSSWNVDPMDGTGPSGLTLDLTKAQILWIDMEWLGVGTVRLGFVINGQFYVVHQFHHANLIASTYITTASLPLRCEIAATSAVSATFKQICATVISEGGYTLTGSQQAVGTPITSPKVLTLAGTDYPIVSLKLKTSRLDAIVILSAISLLGNGNNEVYRWEIRNNCTTTGGSWVSAGANSAVEYNLTGTGVTGGRILASGYTSASNQGSPSIDILKQALFSNQLERDGLTGTPYELSLVLSGANASQQVYGSMDWEEVSR